MNDEEIKQTVKEIDTRHGHLVLTYENETQPGDGLEAHEDRGKLLEITGHLQKTIEAQAEEIKALQIENNGRALAMGVQKSEYDRQAEEIGLLKEVAKRWEFFHGWKWKDGDTKERLKKARAALSAFDSTRDKGET